MGQLPVGAAVVCVGVLVYSLLCLAAVLTVLWLAWGHKERLTYVACLAYLASLGIVASLVQQVHDGLYWRDVVTAQFVRQHAHPDAAQLVAVGSPQGLDLGMFYIQYYTYNAEALLTLFWAIQLVRKVYRPAETSTDRRASRADDAGKAFALLFPVVTIPCLGIPALQHSAAGFMVLADVPMLCSLLASCALLLSILIQYVRARRRFLGSTEGTGASHTDSSKDTSTDACHASHTTIDSCPTTDTATATSGPTDAPTPSYDRWLLARFAVVVVLLAAFAVANMVFQVVALQQHRQTSQASAPALGAAHARTTFALFLPGVSPGLLLFVVFGLTRPHRQRLWAGRPWRTAAAVDRAHAHAHAEQPVQTIDGLYRPGKAILVERAAVIERRDAPVAETPAWMPDGRSDSHRRLAQYRTTVYITAGYV